MGRQIKRTVDTAEKAAIWNDAISELIGNLRKRKVLNIPDEFRDQLFEEFFIDSRQLPTEKELYMSGKMSSWLGRKPV